MVTILVIVAYATWVIYKEFFYERYELSPKWRKLLLLGLVLALLGGLVWAYFHWLPSKDAILQMGMGTAVLASIVWFFVFAADRGYNWKQVVVMCIFMTPFVAFLVIWAFGDERRRS